MKGGFGDAVRAARGSMYSIRCENADSASKSLEEVGRGGGEGRKGKKTTEGGKKLAFSSGPIKKKGRYATYSWGKGVGRGGTKGTFDHIARKSISDGCHPLSSLAGVAQEKKIGKTRKKPQLTTNISTRNPLRGGKR